MRRDNEYINIIKDAELLLNRSIDLTIQNQLKAIVFEIIDTIVMQMCDRFEGLERFKFIQLINPDKFCEFKRNFLTSVYTC